MFWWGESDAAFWDTYFGGVNKMGVSAMIPLYCRVSATPNRHTYSMYLGLNQIRIGLHLSYYFFKKKILDSCHFFIVNIRIYGEKKKLKS